VITEGEFHMYLRSYWPKEVVLSFRNKFLGVRGLEQASVGMGCPKSDDANLVVTVLNSIGFYWSHAFYGPYLPFGRQTLTNLVVQEAARGGRGQTQKQWVTSELM
jgi:hypothetical protein